jgi:hypothetical protein
MSAATRTCPRPRKQARQCKAQLVFHVGAPECPPANGASAPTLRVDEVTEDNVYVLKGLVRDIAAGLDQVDRPQLELALELLSDVGKYVENTIVEDYMQRALSR